MTDGDKSQTRPRDPELEGELRRILKKGRKGGGKGDDDALDRLIERLLGPDTEEGEWIRRTLREIIEEGEETPSERRAKKGDLLEQPGMKEAKQPAALKEGKEAHEAAPIHPGETKIDKPIDGTKFRPDFYDPDKKHIRELKKNNATEIEEGKRKLRLYKLLLDWLLGGDHTMELTTWEKDEKGEYHWRDYILDGDELVPKEEWEKRQKESERKGPDRRRDQDEDGRDEREREGPDKDRERRGRDGEGGDRGGRDKGERDRPDPNRDRQERGNSGRDGGH